jgi:hypothetical protein
MKFQRNSRWKLILLSVIIPMGLFTSFKLAGVLGQQPKIVQTMTAHDTLYWSAERPDMGIEIGDNLSSYYEGDIKLEQDVVIADYATDLLGPEIILGIDANASVQSGYVYEINFTAQPQNSPATELAYMSGYYGNGTPAGGLLGKGLSGISSTSPDGVSLEGAGFGVAYPQKASLEWGDFQWVFLGPQDGAYSLSLISEVVYYNGTVFKSVAQDFLLRLEPRLNNTFETAVELQQDNYTGLYLGGQPEAAYYKIYADRGQRVALDVKGQPTSFDVGIYEPDGTLAMLTPTATDEYSPNFVANMTGYWVLQIKGDPGHGFYSIEVSIS